MTKEQIEKEAKAECFMLTVNTIGIDQRDVELAYILGRNKSIEQIEALEKSCDKTQALTKENVELNDKLNKATEILKVVLNKWKEERWILQSEKEVKMIENVMKEAEAF